MSAGAQADTSTLAHPFLWDDSVCKREVDTRFDCNDLVSSMEASSAGRSKWIPCHSSLNTPAFPSLPLFSFLHTSSITSSAPFSVTQSHTHSLTQTGSCSGLKSPQRRRHGSWRSWLPPLAKGRFEPEPLLWKVEHQTGKNCNYLFLPKISDLGSNLSKLKIEFMFFRCIDAVLIEFLLVLWTGSCWWRALLSLYLYGCFWKRFTELVVFWKKGKKNWCLDVKHW